MATELFAYPYFDYRYHLSGSRLPNAVRTEIENTQGPVIEIGGPTERGYRLLCDAAVLPSKPLVTNVAGFFGPSHEQVDKIVDGKAMPFADNSIGMFLASHIAKADLFEREAIAMTTPVESQDTWAELADKEYVACLADGAYAPKYNLRIGILKEMTRTLVGNGLILFEAIEQKDIKVAQTLGHSVLLQTAAIQNDLYDCVFKKTDSPFE